MNSSLKIIGILALFGNLGLFADSALFNATRAGNVAAVKKTLLALKNPDICNGNGVTTLMLASYVGQLAIAQLVLAQNANPNLATLSNKDFNFGPLLSNKNKGATALMLAAYGAKFDIVCALLKSGAALNMQDSDGQTALVYAILGDAQWPHAPLAPLRKKIIQLLLDFGADPHIKDSNGLDAAYYYSCVAGLKPGFDGMNESDPKLVAQDPLYVRMR